MLFISRWAELMGVMALGAGLMACGGGKSSGGANESSEVSVIEVADCVEVIGFSQTLQMFNEGNSGLEVALDRAESIQLFAAGGLTLSTWAKDGRAYSFASTSSECSVGSEAPETGVFFVSGNFEDDVAAWVDGIEDAIEGLLRNKPSLKVIVLESVIGGPDGGVCPVEEITEVFEGPEAEGCGGDGFGELVRASEQFPYISQAIAEVVNAGPVAGVAIRAGVFPTLVSCSEYCDSKGHIHPDARYAVGERLGEAYRETSLLELASGFGAPPVDEE